MNDFWLVIAGGLIGVAGTYVQSFLAAKQNKSQSLRDARLVVYGKLLSAIRSENRYPAEPTFAGFDVAVEVEKYNNRLREWREVRRATKGIAAEALLLAENIELRNALSEFISSANPDNRLANIESLMRHEVGTESVSQNTN